MHQNITKTFIALLTLEDPITKAISIPTFCVFLILLSTSISLITSYILFIFVPSISHFQVTFMQNSMNMMANKQKSKIKTKKLGKSVYKVGK